MIVLLYIYQIISCFFVDLIENNNLASILIPFSPSTLDIPFSNIGNCIESSKWISIDKNGIVYRFSYELASNLREQSIDFLSKSQGGTLDFFGWGNADEMIFCNFIMYYY